MPPTNDNWSSATALTGTSGFINAQTTVGATFEAGELNIQASSGSGLVPPPPSYVAGPPAAAETVWYSILLPNTTSQLTVEMWFSAFSSTVAMEIQVFYVTMSGAPTAWNYLQEVTYTVDNHGGLGYTNDAGVAVVLSPGTQYYVRVSSRAPSVDGGFDLVYQPYAPITLASCANCPPRIGITGCLETLVATAQITSPTSSVNLDFGNLPAGYYIIRYCGGAFNAWVTYIGGTDTRPYPIGWFVANQPLAFGIGSTTLCLIPHTFVVYNNPGAGTDPGVSGSPVSSWGTIATFNVPLENPDCVPNLLQPGSSLSAPLNFTGISSWTGGIPAYSIYADLLTITQAEAANLARCGSTTIEHLGGHVYLCYVVEDLYPYLTGYADISGSVTWGIYLITPVLNPNGVSGSPASANFVISNTGETGYTNVTVTLSGVSGASAPVVTDLPLGNTTVNFSFTALTGPVTAVLSFSDATGQTFPTCSYLLEEVVIVSGATDAGNSNCGNPATLWLFTFPLQNVGFTLPPSTSTCTVTIASGPAIGTVLSSCTGPVCTGTSKTGFINFSVGSGHSINITTEVPPPGSVTVLHVDFNDPTTGYNMPTYTYTKNW